MAVKTRIIASPVDVAGMDASTGEDDEGELKCPRCGAEQPIRLERVEPTANTCYRCRSCGHIFSPKA